MLLELVIGANSKHKDTITLINLLYTSKLKKINIFYILILFATLDVLKNPAHS
jgi:hypothetical protein